MSKSLAIFYIMGGYLLSGVFGVYFVQTALEANAFQSHSGTQAYVRVK